jgi:hypothetical protein
VQDILIIANKSLKSVAWLKYLGTTVTNKNYIYEDSIWGMVATIQFRIFCLPFGKGKLVPFLN